MAGSLPPLTSRARRSLRTAITDELDRVEEQIASLTRSFDDIVQANENANTDDEHDPEGATIAFERAQVSALLRQAKEDRSALRSSLDRIDHDAAFGVCQVCGEFIGVERLMALPSATCCITCAKKGGFGEV
jgi:RNA polymerase-binding transcription factor DksA